MAGKKVAIIVVLILALALIAAVGYIVYDKWQTSKSRDQQQMFVSGYNQGYTAAVIALIQQTDNCQTTPINIGNFSRQVVDIACLQRTG